MCNLIIKDLNNFVFWKVFGTKKGMTLVCPSAHSAPISVYNIWKYTFKDVNKGICWYGEMGMCICVLPQWQFGEWRHIVGQQCSVTEYCTVWAWSLHHKVSYLMYWSSTHLWKPVFLNRRPLMWPLWLLKILVCAFNSIVIRAHIFYNNNKTIIIVIIIFQVHISWWQLRKAVRDVYYYDYYARIL